jgi:poly-gamma-glutamate synthesis protein (capsule biosynthesis protein)
MTHNSTTTKAITRRAPAALLAVAFLFTINATAQSNAPATNNIHRDTTKLLFTGDILLDRGVRTVIGHQGADALFLPRTDSLLRSCNHVVGNLECPATKIKQPVFKHFIFRAEPEWLPTLRDHGFTHLNLANNHSIDQGRKGLADTKANIEKAGMTAIGAGATMDEASQPVLIDSLPRHIWMIASNQLQFENFPTLPHTTSVSQEPIDSITARILSLRHRDPQCIIIVSLHWGWEHTMKPLPQQIMQAHKLINAGADALICHHTHTLQTHETYRGKPIYYSIGNFIFDQTKPINTKALAVRLTVTKDSLTTENIPIQIRNCKPHWLTQKER